MACLIDSQTGEKLPLHDAGNVVGRGAGVTVQIRDTSVSRRHATVVGLGHKYIVQDLGSRNGVFVNGKQVTSCILQGGDEVAFGDAVYRFSKETVEQSSPSVISVPNLTPDKTVEGAAPATASEPSKVAAPSARHGGDARVIALCQIATELAFAGRHPETSRTVLAQILELVPATFVMLLAPDEREGLRIVHRAGHSKDSLLNHAAVQRVLAERDALLWSGDREDPDFPGAEDLFHKHVRSVLAVPILDSGSARGVFYVVRDRTFGAPFSEADLCLLATVGFQAGKLIGHEEAPLPVSDSVFRRTLQHDMVGRSRAFRECFGPITQAGRASGGVLISGEPGVGKRTVARAVHENSERKGGPFVVVDCRSVTTADGRVVLFGQAASGDGSGSAGIQGRLQAANGGTLVLSEIGHLPPILQVQLFHALKEKRVLPAGAVSEDSVEVRLMATCTADIDSFVRRKAFYRDLYRYLTETQIHVPALDRRREDIPALAEHFLGECRSRLNRPNLAFSNDALTLLTNVHWSRNVQGLKDAIEEAVGTSPRDILGREDFQGPLNPSAAAGQSPSHAAAHP